LLFARDEELGAEVASVGTTSGRLLPGLTSAESLRDAK
jgi:hypothetical protein